MRTRFLAVWTLMLALLVAVPGIAQTTKAKPAPKTASAQTAPLDINTASKAALMMIPSLGGVFAEDH